MEQLPDRIHLLDHPLVRHKMGILRAETTSSALFRAVTAEVAAMLAYEATRHLPTESFTETGWAGEVEVERISGKKLTLVPILRAGLGLLDGVQRLLPGARISVIGLYRDEANLVPVRYYVKLARDMASRHALVLDPMLATGGSLCEALNIIKESGCTSMACLTLVSAPEGIARVLAEHPDVDIYTAAVDSCLNDHGYILPGLGDAGDRLFGTR